MFFYFEPYIRNSEYGLNFENLKGNFANQNAPSPDEYSFDFRSGRLLR